MIVKYNRTLIMAINNTQSEQSRNNMVTHESKSVTVPEKETFDYIFRNALKGNEMAAVLLDEWQRSCQPKDEKEERVFKSIIRAANKIFG